ncbi:MAG TPA: thiamine pyrophosphate-binding protein [Streptosporangiaceae bacterium]
MHTSAVADARAQHADGQGLDDALGSLYRNPDGSLDGLGLALLHRAEAARYAAGLAAALGVPDEAAAAAAGRLRDRTAGGDFLLTGAEAVALLLADVGVRIAFGYPGTSELAICDALGRMPAVTMINARGDKEAAFMSAGASLLVAGTGASVLHGARGLTNAAGAIADARRNEHGSLAVVGLPSTASAKYLPPHGENDLLAGIGVFAKSSCELAAGDEDAFMETFAAAAGEVAGPPSGPVLVGLPQDVAEKAWLSCRALDRARPAAAHAAGHEADQDWAGRAAGMISAAERVVVLADDYLLRYADAGPALAAFCERSGAVVLQVHYRRGPMLFDRIDPREVPAFAGWLDPASGGQRRLLAAADLLVTLEDRNMYPRVTGRMPDCPKLALTSDAAKVRKNGYLGTADLLVEGHVTGQLGAITRRLPAGRPCWADASALRQVPVTAPETPAPAARTLRDSVGAAFAAALATVPEPILVDDGQMFGGLLAESHDRFPADLRIFGGHGGFVGSGISYATGLALAQDDAHVVCSLGDQAFGNGFQGLVAAVEQCAPVVFALCNNGGSVSLLKQARAAGRRLFDNGAEPFLGNSPVEPAAVAAAMGVTVESIDFTGLTPDELGAAAVQLEELLVKALVARRPYLVELRLPAEPGAWDGIWLTRGLDEQAAR